MTRGRAHFIIIIISLSLSPSLSFFVLKDNGATCVIVRTCGHGLRFWIVCFASSSTDWALFVTSLAKRAKIVYCVS